MKPNTTEKEKEDIKCYVCKETFRTRNGMMKHRKKFHIEVFPDCREFLIDQCDFTGEGKECWYKHTVSSKIKNNQDFQKDTDNLAPPSQE